VCDAVIAAQPTRIRSWAEVPAAATKKINATKTLARNFTLLNPLHLRIAPTLHDSSASIAHFTMA
jgi:hypothetical protein